MKPLQLRVPRPYQRLMFSVSALGLIVGLTGGCGRDEAKPAPAKEQVAEGAKKAPTPPPEGLLVGQDSSLRNQLGEGLTTEYKGGRLRTNRWGMRDKDYERTPPPKTRRIAVLGPAHVFGSGVNDAETFEQLVEERLNREVSPRSGLHFELLNFAVPGYTLMQQTLILSSGRIGEFQPDVVMIVGHRGELRTLAEYVFKEVQAGRSLPSAADQLIRKAGRSGELPQAEEMRKLSPYTEDLAQWAFTQASAEIRRMGAQPVYAMIPLPGAKTSKKQAEVMIELAKAAGFLTLNLDNAYQNADPAKLIISKGDHQPNAEGHQVIARRLYEGLTRMPALLAADSDALAKQKAALRAEWSTTHLAKKKAAEENAAKAPKLAALPLEGWTVDAPDGGLANLESSKKDNWMRISISRLPKSSSSQIQIRKTPVAITSGQRYVLSLWMKADENRPVGCGLAEGVAPSAPQGQSKALQVTTWWQEYTCDFTATGTSKDAQVLLSLGASQTPLELSNLQLKNQTTGQVVFSTDPKWRAPVRTPK